ncbi:unnamed protein product [Agarophyton chilense]
MKKQHPAATEDTRSVIMGTAIVAPTIDPSAVIAPAVCAANNVTPTPDPDTTLAAATPTTAALQTITLTKGGRYSDFSTDENVYLARERAAF